MDSHATVASDKQNRGRSLRIDTGWRRRSGGWERFHDAVQPFQVALHLLVVPSDHEASNHHGAGYHDCYPSPKRELLINDSGQDSGAQSESQPMHAQATTAPLAPLAQP